MKLTESIMKRARRNMEENQKNVFLQQQMEAIRETLYGDEADEADELLAKAEASNMPEKVLALFRRETEKLRRYNPTTPDYSVLYSYLETLAALPWGVYTVSSPTLAEAEEVLENDHYGLEKVKERIVEQLALLMHNPDGKSPIICLVGPPGVGKTSIGKSVARALGRKYERVSFGGLHDEAEIRGHRRTYIGAMPGRIIDAVKRAGCSNPVLVLDEIDKIGHDYKGDPGAALLEVLDPEQNCHFHDNYIDVDFDLSKVLFIATANTLSTVSRPLLDRMEIIDISGYLREEQVEIAKRHLLPRIRRAMAIADGELQISDTAIAEIIRQYTAESGVRLLEKKLSSVARKAVLAKMKGEEFPAVVEPEHLYKLLGLAPFHPENYEGNEFPGVVTGLAWTEVGGAILMAEASLSKAKEGGRLTLTGHLGDVMKESAGIAFQWVKAHAEKLGIEMSEIESHALHVHFPEGAVPKDGPSAGITIATAIVSAFTGRRIAPRLAMTGEITLRGRV
ncbi:MAG: endopeptidase La, partial [Muribaculaceae bacterium]|nr:endopeptidase La [Muribaculaceae bacterium]